MVVWNHFAQKIIGCMSCCERFVGKANAHPAEREKRSEEIARFVIERWDDPDTPAAPEAHSQWKSDKL
jgi:hypothetical protein